jgi:hypothetical protein
MMAQKMNEDLKQELGAAGVAFVESVKQSIHMSGSHGFWLRAEAELLSQFRDILMKHKGAHATEELVFYSLILGQAIQRTMDDLHKFDKGPGEE